MHHVRYDIAAPSRHRRAAFSCGVPSLDRWLATQARQSFESRDAVTYLLLDRDGAEGEPPIVGYYCLSAGSVRRADAPGEVARRAPEPVPVVRMGRFAIATSYQGTGWGGELLREALLSAASGATVIGARAVLVDAIDDRAAGFYERFGFRSSAIHPLQMFLAMSTIRASAGIER